MWLCWLVAGCDAVFHLDTVALPVDAPPDSPIDAPQCLTSATFHDGFALDVPCGDWGMTFGSATITEAGGVLRVSTMNAGVSGCSSINPIAFDSRGIFVRIDQPETAANGYVDLLLRDATATFKLQIGLQSGIIKMLTTGSTPYAMQNYDASTMQFWRLRADPMTHEIVGELSGDAVTWVELARTRDHYATTMYFELGVGLQAAAPVAESAAFSHLNTCP